MPTCVWVMKKVVMNRPRFCLFLAILCLVFQAVAVNSWAAEGEISAVQADEVSIFEMKQWSPYAAGFGIGVLSWLVFLLSDNTLGASGAYAKTAGMIERLFKGREVQERAYYREHPPEIGWGWMLLAGMVVGSFLSAWISGDFRIVMVPELWERASGPALFSLAYGLWRGYPAWNRVPLGRRLHQRARHQRYPPTRSEQLDCGNLFFHRGRCDRPDHILTALERNMLKHMHSNRTVQLILGFLMGVCFGFLLQKGGVTHYEVIMGQLTLKDWTVVKVMLSAVLTGMIGIYLLRIPGLVRLHKKSGSFGSTVFGGLIFGIGFALLGYCPGTMAGAVGLGSLDALLGGVVGMLLGTAIYSILYEHWRKEFCMSANSARLPCPNYSTPAVAGHYRCQHRIYRFFAHSGVGGSLIMKAPLFARLLPHF